MNRFITKGIATSLTSAVFLVIGITGVMMYFHILDSYTKNMHEILGLFFVFVVLFHIFFNWKSMKNYFTKKVFLSSILLIFIVVVGFISTSSSKGMNPKKIIIESVLKSQITDAVNILGSDINSVKLKFKKANIIFDNKSSIIKLAKKNKISPFKIVGIIIKE